MTITYSEREITALSSSTVSASFSKPTYTLSADYSMDTADFWRVVSILFALVCMLVFFTWLVKLYLWGKRNYAPADPLDINYLVRGLIEVAGSSAFFFFWFLLFVSCYWLIFFKGQSSVYVILPTASSDLFPFYTLLIVTFICQILYLVYLLSYQCKAEIFFVDWERSKGKLLLTGKEEESGPKQAPVSVWRTIFMTNEWVKLQTHRRVNVPLNLILMYFILEGLGVRYVSTAQPDSSDLSHGRTNPVLLFGINSSVWLLLSFVQIMYRFVIYDRYYRNRLLQFMDLLSLSNISLIAFIDKFHGFYVHGKSVHGQADTGIAELNDNLRKEANDQVPRRGLNDTEQQSFEVFVTQQMRDMYEKVRSMLVAEKANNRPLHMTRLDKLGQYHHLQQASRGRYTEVSSAECVKAHESMNKFLTGFVDKNFKEYTYTVRQRQVTERFVPSVPDLTQGSIFYVDNSNNAFAKLLLYGCEYSVLLFLIILYNLVDVNASTSAWSLLVTYAVDYGICWSRRWGGERAVAAGTVVDRRFFM